MSERLKGMPETSIPERVAKAFGLGERESEILRLVLPPSIHLEFGPGVGDGMIRYHNGSRISIQFIIDLHDAVGAEHARNAVWMASMSFFPVEIAIPRNLDQLDRRAIILRVLV